MASSSSSITESTLLAKLESPSISTPIFSPFSAYLYQFTDIAKKPQTQTPTLIRSLAKQFLPLLNHCLSIIPKQIHSNLRSPPQQDSRREVEIEIPNFVTELFDTYRLCLDCLDLVSLQLSCKPYIVCLQRVRLVCCLVACGLYGDGEIEGLRVLEKVRGLDLEGKEKKKKEKKAKERKGGEFLPVLVENGDLDFAKMVVEVVVAIVKCVALGKSKNEGDYRRVIGLVEEVRPWFRVLEATAYEQLHRNLVTYLGKCTLVLAGELIIFDGDIVRTFCTASLNEYAGSSVKDQIFKFARRICSSVFSLQIDSNIDILICVLDTVAQKCKVELENSGIEFVDLVAYCANKCRAANTVSCSTIAEHLNGLAGVFCRAMTPLDLILRLYAIGLSFTDCVVTSRIGGGNLSKSAKNELAIGICLDDGVTLCHLAPVLGSLQSYFYDGCKEDFASHGVEQRNFACHAHPQLDSQYETLNCTKKSKEVYLVAYLNVLKFLCQPLAELVNSQKRQIIAESGVSSVSPVLYSIKEAFHQLCNIFLYFNRNPSESRAGSCDESMMIISVSVATLILSIRMKHNLQKSVHLIKQIIASEWIQPQGLKYISSSLYNVGVQLHRNKLVNEALKPLKLCCRASWACVKLLCQMYMHKTSVVGDLSEDAILEFVTEACTRTAALLDVLYQSDPLRVEKIMVNSLENWSIAEDLFRRLSVPMTLVKQWVKIRCKINKSVDVDDNAPTLYCLLSPSGRVSERTIGKLLQQELLGYEGMDGRCPEFCHRMQMKVIDILLKEVYTTPDSYMHKSRILIRKGRTLRACGFQSLGDCIQCLSEAISVMKGETCSSGISVSHQLAVAYCLRALCTQEVEPNSKQVFQDIQASLNLWLSIPILDYGFSYDEGILSPDSAILLLYNVTDLLSMKGSVEFHHDIYKLMIKLFTWKNVQLEMCLSILWESRRLTHALCVSPVNDAFIMALSEASGEQFNSIDSWIHCLKGSPPSLVGFQHTFSYLFTDFACGSDSHKTSFQSNISVDDVKVAAIKLVSSVPMTSSSFFIAGYLYYDLCERLIAHGRFFEALSYAKEAHRLRSYLFQEKFMYTFAKQAEKSTEAGDRLQSVLQNLQIRNSIACEIWSFDTLSSDMESRYLSPWKILQCYLESTLQVGVIHEMTGNGVDAESFLLWGKDISCSQCLPLFIVAFSSVLGKLYRKKGSRDLSEKELQNAKHVLAHSCPDFSCLKCKVMLEVAIDQQLADLSRSFFNTTGSVSVERLSVAESLYKAALIKLNYSEWKNSVSYPEEVAEDEGAFVCPTRSQAGPKLKIETRKGRKPKNAPRSVLKEQSCITENNTRLTRSSYRSSQSQNVNSSAEVQSDLLNQLKGKKKCDDLSDPNRQRQQPSAMKSCMVDLGCETTCICNKMKCWFCLAREVKESGLLSNFIFLKWEFARRRLSLGLLSGIGKCLVVHGKFHDAHEIALQSISVLVSRNPFIRVPISLTFLLDLAGKELSWDVFAVERAAVLYNICWLSLKSYSTNDIRTACCDLHHVELPKIVSWLMLAFVLCREVSALFQKWNGKDFPGYDTDALNQIISFCGFILELRVSRLLSAVFILSCSSETFSLPSYCKMLSECHWASYFHQASLGNNLSYQVSNITLKRKGQNLMDDQGSSVTASTCLGAETCNFPRLAPESLQDLEQFVTDFYSDLPCTTVICISSIGGACADLLQELLLYPSSISAWMLLSRLNFRSQPVVMLLPVDSIFEEPSDDDGAMSSTEVFHESNDSGKHWNCPWGVTMVDNVVPAFRCVLEENYLSSSIFPLDDTKENRNLWWMRRKKLDSRLGKLLRKIEDSWFGPWRYVLLGDWSNCTHLDSVLKKLVRDLKSKCKMNVNESFLKVILEGARHALDGESCFSQLLAVKRGCFIGKAGYSEEKRSDMLSEGAAKLHGLAVQLLYQAMNELAEEDANNREPVILVLDCDVQMLPWENMPTLRKQEVYRMPSVGSICFTLNRNCGQQVQVGRATSAFPLIDPLDAFYLLNPSGDLSGTQAEFENWFRDQNLEGKAGCAPTSEELSSALKSHDLFLYFGHGSGAQYISQKEIQKLEKCAATLLMGCSSGSLKLNGRYVPQGTPLSYILAGSPVIVANLWEVTDKDIDRFGKAMLDAWLKERSRFSIECNQCNLVAKEFEAMNIRGGKGNAKKKVKPQTCDAHRQRVGAFMGQAREACTLPFLIGAAPVCYGIPTGIRRKDDS